MTYDCNDGVTALSPVRCTDWLERIAYVLEDSRPTSVVLDSTVQVRVPEHLPSVVLDGFAVETGNIEDADDAPITDADRLAPLSPDNVAIPFKLRLNGDVLSFISTTMIFGTPVDVTLSELALETFFPADEKTMAFLHELAKTLG